MKFFYGLRNTIIPSLLLWAAMLWLGWWLWGKFEGLFVQIQNQVSPLFLG